MTPTPSSKEELTSAHPLISKGEVSLHFKNLPDKYKSGSSLRGVRVFPVFRAANMHFPDV